MQLTIPLLPPTALLLPVAVVPPPSWRPGRSGRLGGTAMAVVVAAPAFTRVGVGKAAAALGAEDGMDDAPGIPDSK